MVHSGQPVPGENDLAIKNEEIRIIVSPSLAAAWKNSKELLSQGM